MGAQELCWAKSRMTVSVPFLPSRRSVVPQLMTAGSSAACAKAAALRHERLAQVAATAVDAISEVLHRHDGLWFWDELLVISRRRE
jgi:hypothetical protein